MDVGGHAKYFLIVEISDGVRDQGTMNIVPIFCLVSQNLCVLVQVYDVWIQGDANRATNAIHR